MHARKHRELRHRRHGFGKRGFGRRNEFFFRGRPAGRGDARAAILALLAEAPMHGYQMIREIEERSHGAWEPSPGSIYPTLQQLEDEGLVRADRQEGRRTYELTDEGRAQAEARTGPAPWERPGDEADADLAALREAAFGLMGAMRQLTAIGEPEQLQKALEILRDTRRRLYQVLAEDSGPTQDA